MTVASSPSTSLPPERLPVSHLVGHLLQLVLAYCTSWTLYSSPWISKFKCACLFLGLCHEVVTWLHSQPQKESDDKSHAEGKAKGEDKHADDIAVAVKEAEKNDKIKEDGYKGEDIHSLLEPLILFMMWAVGAFVLTILYDLLFSDVFVYVVRYLIELVACLMVALCLVFQIGDLMDRERKRKRVKMNHGNNGIKQTGQEGMMARMEEAHFKWLSKLSGFLFMATSVFVVATQVAAQLDFPWAPILGLGVVFRIGSVTRRKRVERSETNRGNNKDTKTGSMTDQWDGFYSSEMMRIWENGLDDTKSQEETDSERETDSEEETNLMSNTSDSSEIMCNWTSEDGTSSLMGGEEEGWEEEDWEEAREQ